MPTLRPYPQGMNTQLLTPTEVDLLFRYKLGRSQKLAKAGLLPHVLLPDGEIRFEENEIAGLIRHISRKGFCDAAR